MAPRSPNLAVSLLVVIATAAAVLLLAPSLSGSAAASACKRWGKQDPGHLTHGHARKAVLCIVNETRHDHGLGHLDRDRRLQGAAQNHSDYMRGHHCFSHQCSGEPSPLSRLQHVGYISGGLRRWAYGENIGWGLKGRGTPHDIVRAWMNSAPHRSAILSHTFKDVGVGFAEGSPSNPHAHGGIYTLDFGLRVG